ncbi:hypothetical protein B0H14DRAFT_3422939 [Mycena olivaceomarginata]|nr:hypothetical protein B0H14DRAFT_3422939 [Mycena olivaceomarginata]
MHTVPTRDEDTGDDAEIARILGELELQDTCTRFSPSRPLLTPPATRSPLPDGVRNPEHFCQPLPPGSHIIIGHPPLKATLQNAGAATQGVPSAHVLASPSPHKKKTKTPAVAPQTEALIRGVPNCIFRGYSSLSAAHAAFDYAHRRLWTRSLNDASRQPIAATALPLPITDTDTVNSLNSSEADDDTWYVVYRGIAPGVYRSHLECQLNTLGVSNSTHERVIGKASAVESPPPMTVIHATGSTSHELKAQRRAERNEKARLRMARKRAELKSRPLEEQQIAAERTKAYQATYHKKHRNDLRLGEERRRIALYKARYGPDTYRLYLKARRQRTRQGAANRAGQTWDIRDLPYGHGYHPEENDGIIG